MLQNTLIQINGLFLSKLWIRVLKNKSIAVSTKQYKLNQLFSTLMIIRKQQIRMISEGSCDTEDWSNDAEN